MKALFILATSLMIFTGNFVNAQCNANFTFLQDSSSIYDPYSFYFTDASSASGNIISYQWDFGDSQFNDSGPTPIHVYLGTGNYIVSLIITDDLGCVDTVSQIINSQISPFVVNQGFNLDTTQYYSCSIPDTVSLLSAYNVGGYAETDSAIIYLNFGDGLDTTILFPAYEWTTDFYSHIYSSAGNYTIQSIIYTPDSSLSDTAYFGPISISATCGNISGTVYADNDNDCSFSAGDSLLANISVYLLSGTTFIATTLTDAFGVYSFNVDTTLFYTVVIGNASGLGNNYLVNCPAGGNYFVGTVPSAGNDFFLTCPSGFDLTGAVTVFGAVPGQTGWINVSASNLSCATPAGIIYVIIDPLLTAQLSGTGSYTISNDTVTYVYDPTLSSWTFSIPFTTSTSASIGDTVCVTMNIDPVNGDTNPLNNTSTFCAPVRSSYDPNEKAANPEGYGLTHAILPGTELTYTIHFQNTGTATAQNILVIDTLNASLDSSTLELIGSSHPVQALYLPHSILHFRFENILLPDSGSDLLNSNGFITYRIRAKSILAQNTQIVNTANIYFDYNPAVVTNSTLHTIDNTLGIKSVEIAAFDVYPNPSSNEIYVNCSTTNPMPIQIFDFSGRIVLTEKFVKGNNRIEISALEEGIYFIKSGGMDSHMTKFVVIR